MSPQWPSQEAVEALRNARWEQYQTTFRHGAGFPEIRIPAPPAQVQININNGSAGAIADINNGRAELQSLGYLSEGFTLVGPPSILECLDEPIPNTRTTYRQFLLQNNLVSAIYEDIGQENVLLVVGESIPFIGDNRPASLKTYGKFSDEVKGKAWKLLEEYMTPTQYFAFLEGSKIELKNKTSDFRLLIDKDGGFVILEGKIGEGMVAASGRIRSYNYPLGDEIAAFLDWFNYKTKELIAQWNCGTYGIVKEGQRR